MSEYTYNAFGLTIFSELECPELLEVSGSPDVFIKFGTAPKSLKNPLFSGVRFQTNGNEFLLSVSDIASYYVTNGENIIIELAENADIKDVRLFLLGSAFGALIHQRGLLPIHGSSIAIGDSAVIFSGRSGAGKSTFAAAFYKKGYPLISDDICVVSLSPNRIPIVHPGYPQMKLWSDSLQNLGEDPKFLPRVRDQINKHSLKVGYRFCDHPVTLKKIYIIASRNSNSLEVSTVKGVEKFSLLNNHTYRFNFIAGAEMRAKHFSYIETLVKNIDVIKVMRPTCKFLFDEIIDLVLQDFKNE